MLVARTRATFDLSNARSILDLPVRYGAIEMDNTMWGFSIHGIGIRFVDVRNLTVIDLETLPDQPALFTLWRLSLFAESRGCRVEIGDMDGIEVANGGMLRLRGG